MGDVGTCAICNRNILLSSTWDMITLPGKRPGAKYQGEGITQYYPDGKVAKSRDWATKEMDLSEWPYVCQGCHKKHFEQNGERGFPFTEEARRVAIIPYPAGTKTSTITQPVPKAKSGSKLDVSECDFKTKDKALAALVKEAYEEHGGNVEECNICKKPTITMWAYGSEYIPSKFRSKSWRGQILQERYPDGKESGYMSDVCICDVCYHRHFDYNEDPKTEKGRKADALRIIPYPETKI